MRGEAIRLGRTLAELMPEEAENLGLLALMLLHDSRRHARVNSQGELVPLEEQDRSKWDSAYIQEGSGLVEKALGAARIGPCTNCRPRLPRFMPEHPPPRRPIGRKSPRFIECWRESTLRLLLR